MDQAREGAACRGIKATLNQNAMTDEVEGEEGRSVNSNIPIFQHDRVEMKSNQWSTRSGSGGSREAHWRRGDCVAISCIR